MAAGGVDDPRVAGAFALVRREDFRGRGPWPFRRWFRGPASRYDRRFDVANGNLD